MFAAMKFTAFWECKFHLELCVKAYYALMQDCCSFTGSSSIRKSSDAKRPAKQDLNLYFNAILENIPTAALPSCQMMHV